MLLLLLLLFINKHKFHLGTELLVFFISNKYVI